MSSPSDSGSNGIPRCVKYTLLGVGAVAAAAGAALYYRRKANAKKQAAAAVNPHRLPEDVAPVHYDLKLTPDMRTEEDGGTHKFQGELKVKLKVHKATSVIRLNALDMTINSAFVTQNSTLIKGKFDNELKDEVLTIHLDTPIQEGLAYLTIGYTGNLQEQLKGFYRSSYKGADGKKKLMATTQFEPTAARLALPCWDEPAFKATFSVKLVVPKGLKAISNMPVIKETDLPGDLTEFEYDQSPVMSTYLLAFVIGDFDFLEGTTSEGTKVRVYTPLGKQQLGQFGLEVALKCLPYFAQYFEISYPLPKCDMLAIPDFAMGAMENWGCVTYRESLLLHDPAESSLMQKQLVALVVAHELAHQWFGNLVTMEWWTHLWLNEGFATWIEYLAVDHIFPEWNIWQQFVSMDMSRSLSLDGLENSHPIEVEVKNANEIDEIFDVISYSKGSCAIRLLVAYLGEENFRRGMAVYLKRYKYSNAFTTDLWRTLAESTGKPVEKVMQSWTRETGYPVIKVSEKNGSLELQQVRFLSARPVTPDQDSSIWAVPISVTCAVAGTKEAVTVETLLTERSGTIALPAGVEWLKLNTKQTGHYRVQYPPAMLSKIIGAISSNDPRLSEEDKLGIQDDAFALVRCGLMEIDSLLALVHAYKSQRGFTLWADLSKNLAGLANILKHTDLSDAFDEFQISLLEETGRELGWTKRQGEGHLTSLLRAVIVGKLGVLGDDATVTEGLERYDRFVASLKSDPEEKEGKRADILPADLRDAAFRIVVQQRGAEGYEQILALYRSASSEEEKQRALRALAGASDNHLLTRTLDFALTDEVRSSDAFMPIQAVLDNRHGTHSGFSWLQAHWDELVKRWGGSFQLGRMINGLTAFASHSDAENVEGFFKGRPAPAAERQVQQTIEKIKSNADWLSRDAATIRSFLEKSGHIERAAKHTRKLPPLRVLVTGAAGQIAYSLIPLLCSGSVLGPDQPIILHLLDIEAAQKGLQGVVMEIQDAGYPLVTDIVATSAVEDAFKGVQIAILLGGFPRGKGMTRADLLAKNSPIFVAHGTALNQYADRNVKVLVVANPANTNCLVASSKAPNIPKENFSALTRLDQNRANAQLSARLRVRPGQVRNAVIWGNHSKSMVPDARLAVVGPTGESVVAYAERELKVPAADTLKWLKDEFVPVVQNRGTSVIETRGASSALSAARASADHIRTWWNGTAPGEVTSMAVYSNGEYGAPKGVFFSFPVQCQAGGVFKVVPNLEIDEATAALLKVTGEELVAERSEALPNAQ